jgi:dihydrofolate reductase
MRLSIIVAVAENGVIGREGDLPWRLSADLQRFKRLTMGHSIIMGRRTWESIGRALPGRRTIVVTRQPAYPVADTCVELAKSLNSALQSAEDAGDDEAFVVGGAELYRDALSRTARLYITRVQANVEGDTFFPEVRWSDWHLVGSEPHAADPKNDYPMVFEIYDRS